MFEYPFFDESVRDQFVDRLKAAGAEYQVDDDLVAVSEAIPDDLAEELDLLYEELLQVSAERMEEEGEGLAINNAGVQFALNDGTVCTVRLDPTLISRITESISLAELRDLVQQVANAVETRDTRPLCHS